MLPQVEEHNYCMAGIFHQEKFLTAGAVLSLDLFSLFTNQCQYSTHQHPALETTVSQKKKFLILGYVLLTSISYTEFYTGHVSPALNGSSAIPYFERSNAIKIRE